MAPGVIIWRLYFPPLFVKNTNYGGKTDYIYIVKLKTMMKRTALVSMLLIATAIFWGCSKNEYNNSTNTITPDPNAMKYTVNGITDQAIESTDSVIIPLGIAYTSGDQEKLTLSVTGLPSNTTASFNVASGIPTFATVLTLSTQKAPAGTYNIKLVCTTAKDSVKTFDIKLTIKESDPCANAMVGKYDNQQRLESSSSSITEQTTAINTTTKNRLTLQNLFFSFSSKEDVDATFNCDDNTLKLVDKDVDLGSAIFVLSGEGTYTANTMDITIRLSYSGNVVYTFKSALTRK